MILLIGGTGVIGGHLRDALIPLGWESSGGGLVVVDKADAKGVPMPYHDYWTYLLLRFQEYPIDTVVLCGAISETQYSHADILDWNTHVVAGVAKLCAKQEAHLIYFSSQMASLSSGHPAASFYSKTKRLAEMFLEQSSADVCILRPYNVWGFGEYRKNENYRSLPYRLADHALEVLWPSERDYIHVSDVAEVVKHAIRYRICGRFDVGTGVSITGEALADCVTYDGYKKVDRPEYIQGKTCADPHKFIYKGWAAKIHVLEAMSRLERRLAEKRAEKKGGDPFAEVEVSTRLAAKGPFIENQDLSEMECSSEWSYRKGDEV